MQALGGVRPPRLLGHGGRIAAETSTDYKSTRPRHDAICLSSTQRDGHPKWKTSGRLSAGLSVAYPPTLQVVPALRMAFTVLARSLRALLPCADDGHEERWKRSSERRTAVGLGPAGVRIAPGSSATFCLSGEPLFSVEKTQVCLQERRGGWFMTNRS